MLRRFSARQLIFGAVGLVALVAALGIVALLVTATSLRSDLARDAAQLTSVQQRRIWNELYFIGGIFALALLTALILVSRLLRNALHASEERYRSLFEHVPIGLYRTTPDGELLDVNPAFAAMLGYDSRAALLAVNAADVYVAREERTRWRRVMEAADDAVEVDREHRRVDGKNVWVRDTARTVRDNDGNVLYYEGALQDITARVRADEAVRQDEARFRSLVENATDGVFVLSIDGIIKYQSPAVERILGYTPEVMAGRTPFELVHPEDLDEVRESFSNVMKPEGHGRSVEFRCRHADGSWRILHVLGTNLLEDPMVAGVVVHMIDVTAQRTLHQQLQHTQRLQAVGRLAGGIAHDFNNLLTAIRGYTDLLDGSLVSNPETAADIGEIRRAVDRAAGLTRTLLAFSRQQVLQPEPTAVEAVVRDVERMLRRLISENVPLITRLEGHCWVNIDAGQLEQVIVNLVVNARDAGPKRGIEVAVECVHLEERDHTSGARAGEYVKLTVSDDGRGIEPEVMPFIFDPFFTTKAVGQGTGLGLATVYGIVNESGGSVSVQSELGKGTRVQILLPCIPAPAIVPMQARPVAGPRHGTERILLVEDELAVRALARRVLTRHGYDVVTAANGVEALEIADTDDEGFDLLVTDVVMPGMGGVPLASALIERHPGLPVLFMSGYTADAFPDRAALERPLHFLQKPFTPAVFAERVRTVLDEPATVGVT